MVLLQTVVGVMLADRIQDHPMYRKEVLAVVVPALLVVIVHLLVLVAPEVMVSHSQSPVLL